MNAPEKNSKRVDVRVVGAVIIGVFVFGLMALPDQSSESSEPSMSDLSCFQLNADLEAIRFRNTSGAGFVKPTAEWPAEDLEYWQGVMQEITARQNRGEDCELS